MKDNVLDGGFGNGWNRTLIAILGNLNDDDKQKVFNFLKKIDKGKYEEFMEIYFGA